ncbi:DUF456 domain-containing protein [Emticicia sp. 21SJ11W-3]|uniref:DUF456 domain-containing protein n=1 Tax=Emticicia sp. 21SJ11W-3 TaxID=2916755 RepID=UPI0020A0F5AD|nr:DUF456 domain-containing protein [Emticicia sp. 21SJ11W-3]UTA68333.1 DUF456 domain-containing protein [Emticicia sp. 21SJ11W-3]
MDIVLLIVAIVCLLIGLAGAVLPLPGPPLSFAGIVALHFTRFAQFSENLLWTLGLLTLVVTVLDCYVPVWGTKKFGGSRYGSWGSMLGMLIGLFFGPFGIFIGAFVGALVGELLAGSTSEQATKAAIGSFIGFLVGIVMKVALCLVMIWYAGKELWFYFS